jgi:hypothetical protein
VSFLANNKENDFDFVVIPGKSPKVFLHTGFGPCMWPWLNPGDRLRIEPVDSSVEIKKGWVVAFEWEGGILSHRIVRVAGDHFWAQGDISLATQGPIHRSKLLGRVVAYRRKGSWNSLEGEFHRLEGLACGTAMHFVLNSVEQWPLIKRLWKRAWSGDKLTKQIGAVLAAALMGDVVVTQETRADVICGILRSDKRLTDGESTETFQRKDRAMLFLAHTTRGIQLGWAVLNKFSSRNKNASVRVLLLNAFVMPLGVEKELFQAIDCAAKRDGIKRLLTSVAKDDVYAQETASIAGYNQTEANTLGVRIRKTLAASSREELIYEKLL